MIWWALVIPALAAWLMYKYLKHSVIWWELVIPILTSILIILICKFSVQTAITADTEYWGSTITKARYFEPYETWVSKTCTYTVSCGKNCTRTVTYDCSYCDETGPRWRAYDNAGNSWSISESHYNMLRSKWNSTPSFVELNRSIRYHFGCGKDGDAYDITWNSLPETAEPAVTNHWYVNKVQASHSAFKMEHISGSEGKKLGLYKYPEYYSYYRQNTILGLDSFNVNRAAIQQKFEYFNAVNGPKYKVKVFVLLFVNKPISIVEKQKAYWDGGNKNELVLCVGLNKDLSINWVKPFSWTDNKRVLVNCREDIAELKTMDFDKMHDLLQEDIRDFKYKDFNDFNYLTVELPTWSYWLTYILTILATVGTCWWAIKNDFTSDEESDDDHVSKTLRIQTKNKFGYSRRRW